VYNLITETPPLFLGITGWLLSKLRRARWILNVSDLWPDSAKYIGMLSEGDFSYKVLQKLAHSLYAQAWLVTGQSREIIDEIQKQTPSSRVHHLSNGVDASTFHPGNRRQEVRRKYIKDGEVGVVYAGLHGLFQGLEQILLAANHLKGEGVRFLLFGDGPEKEALIKKRRELQLNNVTFLPPLPHEQVSSILASMDVAIVPLKAAIRGAVPSKIYEAMACGIPILLVANGEASQIVRQTKAGVAVEPGQIDDLVLTIREMIQQPDRRRAMGQFGRWAAENLFSRTKIAEKFEAILLRGVETHA